VLDLLVHKATLVLLVRKVDFSLLKRKEAPLLLLTNISRLVMTGYQHKV
jgi:hypothetical protein